MRPLAPLPALILLTATASAAPLVPNGSFEDGAEAPTGWALTGEGGWSSDGGHDGRRFVTVAGGDDGGRWLSDPVALEPGGVYELRLRFRYRPEGAEGGANAFAGPECAIELWALSPDDEGRWVERAMRFVAPSPADPSMSRIGLGQWRLKGSLDYDSVELHRVKPAHRVIDGMSLGSGETVSDSYRFAAPLSTWRGISRPLHSFTARFHDNRWRFSRPDDCVVYRHEVAGRRQTSASITPTAWFHEDSSWRLSVDVSTDGQSWQEVGGIAMSDSGAPFSVPEEMLPAEVVYVRLRCNAGDDSEPVFLQCTGYEYEANLDAPVAPATGHTTAVTVLAEDGGISVEPISGGQESVFAVRVTSKKRVTIAPRLLVAHEGRGPRRYLGGRRVLEAGETATVSVAYEAPAPGQYTLELALGAELKTTLAAERSVSVLAAGNYGESLPSPDEDVALWWAASGWKVGRSRPAPKVRGTAVRLRLARNEAESAQVVVRPDRELRGLVAEAGALRSRGGATLPESAIEVLRVRYVNVEHVSDGLGGLGEWPDPLPSFRAGLNVAAGRNQPLWVTVRAPKDASPGRYRGTVELRAEGFQVEVPLEVDVYDFTLPDETTCRSLFGFDWSNVERYHKLETDAEKREVLDKYLRSFSDHRISPYDPAPLDAVTYTWDTRSQWNGGKLVVGEARSGTQSFEVRDNGATSNTTTNYAEMMAVSGEPLSISLWYRTETDEPAALYLQHFDRGRGWFYGRNRHIPLPASREWRRFEMTVSEFPPRTAFVSPMVQGCQWTQEGERTGAVWIDDLSIVDTATGEELVEDGGFEEARPVGPETGVEFDWTAWDAAMGRAVDQYHFNSFVFHVPGLGGGTFHARVAGSLLGYSQKTPEHLALFRTWCGAAREHLAERGLLRKAVCYPFDEPDEKDYEFVVEQLRYLKEGFPGLHRMVPMHLGAAEPFVGNIDYWCPVLSTHIPAFAAERHAAGDLYTWYICCAPKAPYIANFIDRPATDLRVWLWQTWAENVNGILIWQSIYWHSPPAYPDSLQDPYDDSMSWVRGYGTKPGEKRRWNVGDGRFMYPPERATGTQDGPVIEGPVSSIRWEALRDGMEDYEYLAMLKRLLEEKRERLSASEIERYEALLKVPPEISRSLTDYTTDPAPVAARRHQVAKAIERLSR